MKSVKPVKNFIIMDPIDSSDVLERVSKELIVTTGKIRELGPDVDADLKLSPGDHVMFQDYGRVLINQNNRNAGWFIKDENIIGKIEK